jgi:hypothetical protein
MMKHVSVAMRVLACLVVLSAFLTVPAFVQADDEAVIFVNLSNRDVQVARYYYQAHRGASTSAPAGDYRLPVVQEEKPEGWWFKGWWSMAPGESLYFDIDEGFHFHVKNADGPLTWSDLDTSTGYIDPYQKFEAFVSKADFDSDIEQIMGQGFQTAQFQTFSSGQYTIGGDAYEIVSQEFPFDISSRAPKSEVLTFEVPGNIVDYGIDYESWRASAAEWRQKSHTLIELSVTVSGAQTSFGGARKPGYYRGTVTIYYTQRNAAFVEEEIVKEVDVAEVENDSIDAPSQTLGFIDRIVQLQNDNYELKTAVFGLNGAWTIVANQNDAWWNNLPDDVANALRDLYNQESQIKDIAYSPTGRWVILYDYNGYWANGIPQDAFDKLVELSDAGRELKRIAFTPDGGWVIFYDYNDAWWSNIPESARNRLNMLYADGSQLKDIAFFPTGGWVILCDYNGAWLDDVSQVLFDKIVALQDDQHELKDIAFGPNGEWSVLYDYNGAWIFSE